MRATTYPESAASSSRAAGMRRMWPSARPSVLPRCRSSPCGRTRCDDAPMVQRAIGFGLEDLPRIVRGAGSYLFDAAGRRYLDGSGGPAAFCIGHAHPEVNAAIAAQLAQVACAYRYLFTSTPLEELSELILRRSGATFGHVVYSSSGSEAMESALKIALQYWHARGQPQRRRFIARHRSYHGNTLGALSVSGFAERRGPFEGSLLEVTFVSAANL